MSKKEVPIVYASDNAYAPYMYISMKSLISHTNLNTVYIIYVLYTGINEETLQKIRDLEQEHVSIFCIDIKERMENLKILGSGHLSAATCYRLFIAELFEQYSKIVYIDSDTVILEDIEKFYQISLEGKTVGAIHDVVCTFLVDHYRESINMDVRNGFNAGILLIDTKRFKEKGIKEKCIKLLEEDSLRDKRKFFYMDQDVLNLTLRDEVFFIDSRWNFQWQYLWRLYTVLNKYQQRYIEDAGSPKIIHYAGNIKPWERPDLELADVFWKIARSTEYYERILFANINRCLCI